MPELIESWATAADACGPCAAEDSGIDAEVLAANMRVASEILFAVTGYQWPGVRTDVWRPPGVGCGCPTSPTLRVEHPRAGSWVSEVHLPGYPVVSVSEVLIDGVVVDPELYRVDDSAYLVWRGDDPANDGRSGWPCCQRMRLDADQDDTWQVTYQWGAAPPDGGVKAAAALGCEFSLGCSTDSALRSQCRLPRRVASITRQGVTVAVLDNLNLFAEGRTGIPEVDLWVGSVLLGRKRRRAGVIDTQAWARGRRGRRNDTTPAGS